MIILSTSEIEGHVARIATRIQHDHGGSLVHLVVIMDGAFMFAADLIRQLAPDAVSVEFARASSYGDATVSSGLVRVEMATDPFPQEAHVIIVEDIVDTGLTISTIRRHLSRRGAGDVQVAALIAREESASQVTYLGKVIGNEFVYGYGLDRVGTWRGLNEVRGVGRT